MKILEKYLYVLYIMLGSLFVAVAINLFIASNSFAFGGVSGIAVIGYELFAIPLGVTNFAINIPLFLLGIKNIGKEFFSKSIFATLMMSVFLSLTSGLIMLQIDPILSAIFGGALLGSGVGIVVKAGGSTGGTDMAALILNKQFKIPLSICIFMIDSSVILLGAYLFGINEALYSIVVVFFLAKAVELTIKNFDSVISHLLPLQQQRGNTPA